MNKLLILLTILSLAGCSNEGERATKWTEAFKELRDDCTGVVTFTLSKSSWGEKITMSCAEELSDD